MPFSLYRVAEVAPNGQFTLLPAYTGSGAAVDDLTTAEKEQVAVKQLTAWVQTQKLSPDAQKTTDNQGTAAVSRLKTGLYLVIGEKTQIGKNIYTCSPSLVSIPEWQEETGSWNYAVTMLPKNTGKPADVPASAKPDKKPTPSSTRPNKNLPNTGILQWPIPTLAGIGVVCMLLGWQLKRKKR